jgi:hypothetical protein
LTLSAVPDIFHYVPIQVPKRIFGYHESIGYGQLGGESLPLRHISPIDSKLLLNVGLGIYPFTSPNGFLATMNQLVTTNLAANPCQVASFRNAVLYSREENTDCTILQMWFALGQSVRNEKLFSLFLHPIFWQ